MSSSSEIGSLAWMEHMIVRESWNSYLREECNRMNDDAVKPFSWIAAIEAFYRSMVNVVSYDPNTGEWHIQIAEDCHSQEVINYTSTSNIYGDLNSLFCFQTEMHSAHYYQRTNWWDNQKEPLLSVEQRKILVCHWTLNHSLEETARHLGISIYKARYLKNDAVIKIRDFVFYDVNEKGYGEYTWDIKGRQVCAQRFAEIRDAVFMLHRQERQRQRQAAKAAQKPTSARKTGKRIGTLDQLSNQPAHWDRDRNDKTMATVAGKSRALAC